MAVTVAGSGYSIQAILAFLDVDSEWETPVDNPAAMSMSDLKPGFAPLVHLEPSILSIAVMVVRLWSRTSSQNGRSGHD